TASCPAGHRACIGCVIGSIQSGLSSARTNNTCIGDKDGKCNEHYSNVVLQHILDNVDYQRFNDYQTNQQVQQLKNDRLQRCPFCGYVEFLPEGVKASEQITFYCQNKTCMKISCLKCQQLYHLPVLCPPMEAEKGIGSLHLAVQSAIEGVLIRHCPACNLPSCKTQGCNHITCRCGINWCYVCGKQYNGSHFGLPPLNCKQFYNNAVEEKNQMRIVAQNAVQVWKAQHPDMPNLTIDLNEYLK
ncbi:MAG: putative ubiquitin conjugating enzyme interacting protein, partial [Streblomastix strix]